MNNNRSKNPKLIVFTFIVLLIVFVYFSMRPVDQINDVSGVDVGGILSGVSGKRFQGLPTRKFSNARQFDDAHFKITKPKSPQAIDPQYQSCRYWAVVTTIFEISESIERIYQEVKTNPAWCLVIALDEGGTTADHFPKFSRVAVLDPQKQKELFPQFSELPWKHFGRKNIGYLFAIQNNAEIIFDFDDDNLPTDEFFSFVESESLEASTPSIPETHVFNPYPLYQPSELPSWPRGFPLDDIRSSQTIPPTTAVSLKFSKLGVIQLLANHDPDVDAIYRLVGIIPFTFEARDLVVEVPKSALTPYNAQATLWMNSSFWGMFLPITVHGRVSDIWRSYFVQGIFKHLGLSLAFGPPLITQYRNAHDYLADFNSEIPLYTKATRLAEIIAAWKSQQTTVPGLIEEIWIDMYEREFIEISDVTLIQTWLKTLNDMGYKWPNLAVKKKN